MKQLLHEIYDGGDLGPEIQKEKRDWTYLFYGGYVFVFAYALAICLTCRKHSWIENLCSIAICSWDFWMLGHTFRNYKEARLREIERKLDWR
jgi:hypothetical protein